MRLIDADTLKTIKSIQKGDFNSIETIQKWIDDAPTVDAVEVVRCKDCKCKEPLRKGAFGDVMGYDGKCSIVMLFIRDNYYCSWGEKR